jgi:hypothetical protein
LFIAGSASRVHNIAAPPVGPRLAFCGGALLIGSQPRRSDAGRNG